MTEETIDALRGAKVPWAPGMRTTDGHRIVRTELKERERRLWQNPARVALFADEDGRDDLLYGDLSREVPDLADPATFALCLQELARRVGLDPSQGAVWNLSEEPFAWWVEVPGDVFSGMRALTTDAFWVDKEHRFAPALAGVRDPLLALALALKATAPAGGVECP